MTETITRDGWAVGSLDSMGKGPGFEAGGFARVDPAAVRSFRNVSDKEEAVCVCVGGACGYVGRDGVPEGATGPR